MSLILEALKKSEAQRRLGEAPSLGTPFATTRRQRSPLPWITLAVVLIAGGVGWWLWHASLPAVVNVEATSSEHPGPGSTQPNPGTAPSSPPSPPISAIPPPSMPHSTVKQDAASTASATSATTIVKQAPAVAAETAARTQTPAAPTFTVKSNEAKKSLPHEAAPSATQTAQASTLPAAPAEPAEVVLPTINDFPYDVRHALPDLPISMQVYSRDPSRRFIIINGERKVEGDAIGDVAIREIRANGVVLEFRGQRFLLPRPGS